MRRTKDFTKTALALLSLLLAAVAIVGTGCGTDCTDASYDSVYVRLVDAEGHELEYELDEAVVEYRDRADGQWRSCSDELFPLKWICAGRDNPGVYDVRATVGELSGMVTDIRVPQDREGGCHITTQSVDVVMQ